MKTNLKRKLKSNEGATSEASYKNKKKRFHKNLENVTSNVEAPVNVGTNEILTKLNPNKKRKREAGKYKDAIKSVKNKTKLEALPLDTTENIECVPESKKSKNKKKKILNESISSTTTKKIGITIQEDSHAQISNDRNERTLFVGNVGVSAKKEELLKAFRQYGKIESIRLRGITPADPKTSKRLAAIKRMFHPKRTSLHSYIVFQNKEDATKAIELNGTKLKENIIRVQLCNDNAELEPSKAIFIGNIPFDTEENELWNTFDQYGKIISVRLIRNSETGMCIGIGYVNFESSDAVELVLMTDLIMIKNRELRIQRYSKTKIKKCKEGKHPQKFKEKQSKSKNQDMKKPKHKLLKEESDNKEIYHGSKFVQHKKKMKNKTLRQNMKMVEKIAPR